MHSTPTVTKTTKYSVRAIKPLLKPTTEYSESLSSLSNIMFGSNPPVSEELLFVLLGSALLLLFLTSLVSSVIYNTCKIRMGKTHYMKNIFIAFTTRLRTLNLDMGDEAEKQNNDNVLDIHHNSDTHIIEEEDLMEIIGARRLDYIGMTSFKNYRNGWDKFL